MTSIIIPTYNRSSILAAAVESAWSAGSDIEVIVVDDASTDDTPLVCSKIKNIRSIRLPHNQGQAAARNAGVRIAQGDFVSFLDDDDIRIPGSINRQLKRFSHTPEASMVYGRMRCEPGGNLWPTGKFEGDVFWQLIECNFIPVMSPIIQKSEFLSVGMFDETLRLAEDWDLWLRLAARSPFAFLDEPVAVYQEANPTSGQLSSDQIVMALNCKKVQKRALDSNRGLAETEDRRKQVHLRLLERHWFVLALASTKYLLENQPIEAKKCFWNAFRLIPRFSLLNPEFYSLYGALFTNSKLAEVKYLRKRIQTDLKKWESLR